MLFYIAAVILVPLVLADGAVLFPYLRRVGTTRALKFEICGTTIPCPKLRGSSTTQQLSARMIGFRPTREYYFIVHQHPPSVVRRRDRVGYDMIRHSAISVLYLRTGPSIVPIE